MTSIDHNKLLKKIAKERLKDYRITQKGQSRVFLQDNGWYSIMIEFQPSSWSKGTYLNIGVDFNFFPREHSAFEYESRQKNFIEFSNQEQFEQIVYDLCNFTIEKVEELNSKFKNFSLALKALDSISLDNEWNLYNVAILNAVNGYFEHSKQQFGKIMASRAKFDWQAKRQEQVEKLIDSLNNTEDFKRKFIELISETREMKKLTKIELEEFEINVKRKKWFFNF